MHDSTTGTNGDAADGFEIRRLIRLVRDRWKLIALSVAASLVSALSLGLGYLGVAPRVHEATVVVEVPRRAPMAVNMESTTDDGDLSGDEMLKTIEQNLQRISLFRSVMAREEIAESVALHECLDEPVEAVDPDELAQLLGEWTRVRHRRGTRLISITVEHCDATFAKKLANAVVEEFLRQRNEARSGTSDSALDFLLVEAQRVRNKLQESEDELLKLQEFEDALALKKKMEEQEDLILELAQRYRDKHPTLIQARSRLAALRDLLRAELLPARGLIGGEVAADSAAMPGAASQDGEDEQLAENLKRLETRFNVLALEVETNRSLYETLTARLSEANVTRQWDAAPFQIVEPAYVPVDSAKPSEVRVLGVSVVLGGGLGMGLVWILIATDNSLRTAAEAERSIDLPVLGTIPSAGKSRKRASLVALNHGGPVPEALRALRAALTRNGHREGRKTILITSALPGEGKSFIAANLAAGFAAEAKEKTLIIDANLGAPRVGEIFGADLTRTSGLRTALEGKADLESCVVKSGIDRLDLLLLEAAESNSAELFSGDDLDRLFERLAEKYERVIIDSPQVNSVSDGLLLASHVDAAILVARAARTPRDIIARARDLLEVVGCRPAGLVLNELGRA